MKNIKINLAKTFSIATVVAISFQSTVFANNVNSNKLNNSYPIKKDIMVFKQFRPSKELMVPLNKNVSIIYHKKDGSSINLDDKLSYPINNLNGRTSIAIKDITELFNLNINWNGSNRIVEVYGKGVVLRFPIDKNVASKNNKVHPIEAAATISNENNRTYLPIRYLLENLGYKVKFNSSDNSIHIYE